MYSSIAVGFLFGLLAFGFGRSGWKNKLNPNRSS